MVLCTGSIAYDYILTFKGRFKDHILLDKTHILNLSFLVDDLQKRRGGVAGNYAYNLALLGHPAAVLATAVEEVAVGAAQAAAEIASDPMRAARKQVRGFERKGTPAVRRINRRLNALIPDRDPARAGE